MNLADQEKEKNHIIENAKIVLTMLKSQYDKELSYDINALRKLESIVNAGKTDNIENHQQLLTMVSCFLGECFIHKFGGEWKLTEYGWAIMFNEKNAVFPFNKVWKFYENGSGDSFVSMFEAWEIIKNNERNSS